MFLVQPMTTEVGLQYSFNSKDETMSFKDLMNKAAQVVKNKPEGSKDSTQASTPPSPKSPPVSKKTGP